MEKDAKITEFERTLNRENLTQTDKDIMVFLSDADHSTQRISGQFIAMRLNRSPGNVFYRLKVLETLGYVGKSHLATYHLTPAIKAQVIEWKEYAEGMYSLLLDKAVAIVSNVTDPIQKARSAKTWTDVIYRKTGKRISVDMLLRQTDDIEARVDDILKEHGV